MSRAASELFNSISSFLVANFQEDGRASWSPQLLPESIQMIDSIRNASDQASDTFPVSTVRLQFLSVQFNLLKSD